MCTNAGEATVQFALQMRKTCTFSTRKTKNFGYLWYLNLSVYYVYSFIRVAYSSK